MILSWTRETGDGGRLLSGASPAPEADTGPTMLELADRIKVLQAAQTIDALPQRTGARGGSTAAEPITERIRRRMESMLTV